MFFLGLRPNGGLHGWRSYELQHESSQSCVLLHSKSKQLRGKKSWNSCKKETICVVCKFTPGFHVVGSILGSAMDLGFNTFDSGTPKHNGMAPGAKVAFTDIFTGASKETMFESAYLFGARIHTNSWGSGVVDNSYTSESHQYDSVAYEHPDYLILFAASNDGMWSQHGATVGAPATCKNCLSVGASAGAVQDAQASGEFPRLIIGDTEVPCVVEMAGSKTPPVHQYFSGPSIFLKDYCQSSIGSLSGFIAVVDSARSHEECSLQTQVIVTCGISCSLRN
jgi:hypothetical protein